MDINFQERFQSIIKYFRPSAAGSVADIRDQVLRSVSWVMVVAGFALLQFSFGGIQFTDMTPLYTTSLISFTILLLVTIFSNRVPYTIRVSAVIFITGSQGYLNMASGGVTNDSYLWLMFGIILSTILIGIREGLVMIVVSTLLFAWFGYQATSGKVVMGGELTGAYNAIIDSWINIFLPFILISLVLTLVNGLIIRGIESSREELEDSLEENVKVTNQLEQEQNMLALQALDLERRVAQIRTAAEIASTMGSILDPEVLLQNVADLIQERFDLYYVGVFVVDENRRFADLVAGTGEPGRVMMANNHQLSIGGSSMVGWSISHSQPRISLDVGTEAIRFQNPNLPQTRSELAIPIRVGNQTNGAISVQSSLPEAFDENDIVVYENIANSLAIALENASLFDQFESSLKEIQQLNRQYTTDSWKNIWVEEEASQRIAEKGSLPLDASIQEVEVPMRLRGEQVIGNISLATEQASLSPEEMEFVEAISDQAAIALESARLLDEANHRVEQERAIQNLTTQFSQSLDFETLLQKIVEEISQIPLVKETSIHVTPPEMLENTATSEQN